MDHLFTSFYPYCFFELGAEFLAEDLQVLDNFRSSYRDKRNTVHEGLKRVNPFGFQETNAESMHLFGS